MNARDCKKIRQVNGAGDWDVVVLYDCGDGILGYQVPLSDNDMLTFDVYDGYETEEEAIEAGFEHLAELEGCSLKEYKRRVAAGE